MTERRQFVGHTSSAEADQFTGLSRELTVDMQAETLRVHDGNTRGGFPLARADMANVSASVLDARTATKESISNKTSTLNSSSTDAQYPTARAVYNLVKNSHATGDIKASLQATNHGNWLLCNGQAVSRTDYPELFSLIGVSFGAGDGTLTFNVPDYRGKFLRGLGGNSEDSFSATQSEGLPNITGSLTPRISETTGRLGLDVSGCFSGDDTGYYSAPDGGGDFGWTRKPRKANLDASLSNSIYGASEHVTPVNQAINWFIYSA